MDARCSIATFRKTPSSNASAAGRQEEGDKKRHVTLHEAADANEHVLGIQLSNDDGVSAKDLSPEMPLAFECSQATVQRNPPLATEANVCHIASRIPLRSDLTVQRIHTPERSQWLPPLAPQDKLQALQMSSEPLHSISKVRPSLDSRIERVEGALANSLPKVRGSGTDLEGPAQTMPVPSAGYSMRYTSQTCSPAADSPWEPLTTATSTSAQTAPAEQPVRANAEDAPPKSVQQMLPKMPSAAVAPPPVPPPPPARPLLAKEAKPGAEPASRVSAFTVSKSVQLPPSGNSVSMAKPSLAVSFLP